MANQQGLVHPQLLGRLQTNFYPSLCTIQAAGDVRDSYGGVTPAWADLPGHVDIPCRVAPDRAFNREVRTEAQLYAVHSWVIALSGKYPAITEEMRAVVDGTAYDIELVQGDGQGKTTRLMARVAA